MGGSVQFGIVQSLLIGFGYLVKSIYAGIEDVSIHGEAMRCPIGVGRHGTAKSVQLNLLVGIVELEDGSYALDGLQVLVLVGVEEVEGIAGARVTV